MKPTMTSSDYILQYHKRGEEIDRLNKDNKWLTGLIDINDQLRVQASANYWRGVMGGIFAGFVVGAAMALVAAWGYATLISI